MAPMRIVSLLPSATEILFALGLDQQVVGVSHECDFPQAARSKTVVIHSRIPKDASPSEIDRLVREFSARGESVYFVDAEALRSLSPDLIVTQDLCHVCAASPEDLASVLANFESKPEVLSLNPLDLGDVWRDILLVGEQTFHPHAAEKLIESIGEKLGVLEQEIQFADDKQQGADRPAVAFLEWLQPIYVGGHWVPGMINFVGGHDVFGEPSRPSFRVTLDDVARHPCRSKRTCLRARCQQLFLAPRSSSSSRPRNSCQVAAPCHRCEQGSGSCDRANRRGKTRRVGVVPTLCAHRGF